jgi:small subunit ribosomal protein S20
LKGAFSLASHKSAIKRARQNEDRRLRNRSLRTRAKSNIKDVRLAVGQNQREDALRKLNEAKSVIDKASKRGVIHKRAAARKISRLSRLVNTLGA